MSITEVMVAFAVLGVLALGAVRFFSNTMQAQKIAQLNGELTDVRNLLRASLDCDATTAAFAAASCSGLTENSARRVNATSLEGKALARSDADLALGASFLGRASCYDLGSAWGIRFEFKERPAIRSGVPDLEQWQPLFSHVPFTCRKILKCKIDAWLWEGKVSSSPGLSCSSREDVTFPGWTRNFAVGVDVINSDDANAKFKHDGSLVAQCPPESNATAPAAAAVFTHLHVLPSQVPLHPGVNVVQTRNFNGFGGPCGMMAHVVGTWDALDCDVGRVVQCARTDLSCY